MVDTGFINCACGADGSGVIIEDLAGHKFKPETSTLRDEDGKKVAVVGDDQVRLKCPDCGHSQMSYYPQRFKLWRIHQDMRRGKEGCNASGTV